MDYTFPEKYFKVALFFDHEFGDLETTTKLDDRQKLLLYALRQQAEHGPCTSAAPPVWWTRDRFKHAAWKQLGGMSKFEAMVHFVKLVEEYLGGEVNWVEKCRALTEGESPAELACSIDEPCYHVEAHDDEECAWDDDVRAHLRPTVANVRYLATQVMKLRQEIAQLYTREVQRRDEKSSTVELVPPEKPVPSRSDTGRLMVPPMRSSPLCMTEAALKSTRVSSPAPRTRVMGWAEWLGLN
ncbi:hypothetical protein DQ04_02241080 [Trypanosoma grayi]|uniref:hypothetical protein n=1 Tax=Trypanosoma grayi TaxID=71804 RepID=UPI0004F4B950|nr:hypothetical protein DQ04_02241080 [Trypanosoma grayi]KEG11830.1 hypothetical protein DQ04_02241080 [Trypanosoma grayi]